MSSGSAQFANIPTIYSDRNTSNFSVPGRVAVGNVSGNRCVSDCRSSGSEIDQGLEIIFMVILLPFAETFKKGCCQLQEKYVHEVLNNCLFKHAQKKSLVR